MLKQLTIRLMAASVLITLVLSLVMNANAKPITRERAQEIAQEFVLKEQTTPPKVATEIKGEFVLQNKAAGLSLGDIQPITDDSGIVLAYVQELEPQGFIITSADDAIGSVLGFSFSHTLVVDQDDSAPLIEIIISDVVARQNAVASGAVISKPPTSSAIATQWGPLIETDWHQTGHFDDVCPTTGGFSRCLAGCVATALAQILNYWDNTQGYRFLGSVTFNSSDAYISNGDAGNISIDGDAAVRQFPSFGQVTDHFQSYTYDNTYEAYLSFAAGISVKMNYGYEKGSGTPTSKAASALRDKFLFGSASRIVDLFAWTRKKDEVVDNIKNDMPVQVGISYYYLFRGHSVVVDGYRDTDEYFHVNLGWSDESVNFWYDLPTIETEDYDFNLIKTIVYDILPYQGWNQYGADERKTFRSPYAAPYQTPIREKWHVTCSGDYHFTGLIVGTGNMIVASCTPRHQSQGNAPSVWFIDQYGTKLEEVFLVNEDENLTMPVQSLDGKVYVGTGDGGVYEIDLEDRTASKVFQESSNEQFFDPPSVDQDGNTYFNTFYTLYCLAPSGSERWHFTAPNGGYILEGSPAIDENRGYVYVCHYDPNTKMSYLRCINRANGSMVGERVFAAVAYTSPSARHPSLGADGTIYIGHNTTLYAINPGPSLSIAWSRDFAPGLMSGKRPVVGDNGRLYVAYWSGISGSYLLNFGAIDANNGSTIWSESYPNADGDNDIHQPYLASNDVIVFPFHYENGLDPDTYEVHAYRDNGTNATLLWQKSFGSDGGNLAFGPGRTVYVIPSSGYGHTITVITDGEEGDPEEGGMGFTDNSAPSVVSNPTPSDGAENLDTSSIQLAWTCSDPEGHSLKYDVFVCALLEGEEAAFVPVASQVSEDFHTLTDLQSGTQYLWSVVATDGQAFAEGPVWSFSTEGQGPDDVEEIASPVLPTAFSLSQNYPNPFNPETRIEFTLSSASFVSIDVINILGQGVRSLVSEHLSAGYKAVTWDGRDESGKPVSSGIYFYRMVAGDFAETKKCVLLK